MSCGCYPYKSPLSIILAQVLSTITLILSFAGFWPTWILGLVAVILLWCLACTDVHESVAIISMILAVICASLQFFFAAQIHRFWIFCDSGYGYDSFSKQYQNDCYESENNWVGVAIAAGVGWVLTSLLCCFIVQVLRKEHCAKETTGNVAIATTLAVPNGTSANGGDQQQSTKTETVTVQPDGTKRTEVTSYNYDGSITVTVTEEKAAQP